MPFLPSLPRPVLPPERYHAVPRIGATRAEQTILNEILDADVDEKQAKANAAAALARHSSHAHALIGESEVNVRAIHFVRYPVWFARYRYRGEASPEGNDLFYVGISALDGVPITAEHP